MAKIFYNILPFLHMYNRGMGIYQIVRRPSSPTYRGSTVYTYDPYVCELRNFLRLHLWIFFV